MKSSGLTAMVPFLVLAVACGPKGEPKQVSAPDPVDEGAQGSQSSSGGKGGNDVLAPPPGGGASKGGKGEAPNGANIGAFLEGLRWGMTHAEVNKAYSDTGGIIWKDYDQKLSHARVGPEMTALEAEREQQKAAVGRTYIEFKDTPTGYDATGIKPEYTYRNKESLMWVQREGKKRYFFFINDRLWKIYDEVPLSDGGAYGKSYLDACNTLNGKVGIQGRVLHADPSKGVVYTTVDWKDGSNHLRAVDRSSERVVGVVVEDASMLANLANLRSNKAEDPTAIDPTITAVTNKGLSDPNAPQTAGSGKPAPTKPPKKK